jgi:hypothetical protein
MLHGPKWRDRRPRIPWLITARQIGKEHACRIVFDTSRRWEESAYLPNYRDHGPAVLAGGAGEPIDVCTSLLHELGHHLIAIRQQASTHRLTSEAAAWKAAHQLAARYRLPLNPRVRRTALYSYRYGQILAEVAGSKARTRRRPSPPSWRLEQSRRSADLPTCREIEPIGKKGKRHTKRFIKRATARAERRKAAVPERGDSTT